MGEGRGKEEKMTVKFEEVARGRAVNARVWGGLAALLPLLAACLAAIPGADGQNNFFGVSDDLAIPPTITWLYPPKGHIVGGTSLTIYGSGFKRSAESKVRFAIENEFDEVDVIYISESEVRCVTPRRNGPGTAHVTASNDGLQFSGFPLVYTKGSGTFLKFIFDNSEPGCLDCLNSMDGDGLNPLNLVEKWFVDNATGPYIGGTQVTITAKGLDFARANFNAPYDLFLAGTAQKYNGPVGGPGTPHPHNIDPMSAGNGPPVTGTFYPHRYLKCLWECELDTDQNKGSGDANGVDLVETSQWVTARWLDYTRVMCESPPMTVPGAVNQEIGHSKCKIRVSNNQQTYHQDAYAEFWYQDKRPTVTNIKTNQFSVWPARGPFNGNTELTVIGTNFLPSKYLKCKFGGVNAADGAGTYVEDDVSHIVGEVGGRVRYISSTEIVCITPIFGPASQREQYPSGVDGSIGSGAILDVVDYTGADSDVINEIKVVSGGRGYTTPPVISFHGGGGCCAVANATVDEYGAITKVEVLPGAGGKNWNRGDGAQAVATLSTGEGKRAYQTVASINVTDGGSGYLAPPDVNFTCAAGGSSCFQTGDVSNGYAVNRWSPGQHARAVAVMGSDAGCDRTYERCQGPDSVVRVDILYPGEFYKTAPTVTFSPQKPHIRVTPNELHPDHPRSRNRGDPSQVGYYSKQGKSADELDPEVAHGSWPDGALSTSVPYDVVFLRYPNGGLAKNGIPGIRNGRMPGTDDAVCDKADKCPEFKSPEDRGPLLPPLGKAFMDGSIKPGHQELIRVSNNYHKFGAFVGSNENARSTHVGYRDITKDPNNQEDMGYWLWSVSGMTSAEMNRCRVSNNPPVHQFGVLQGHGLDAAPGLGTADDEFQIIGPTNNLRYLDGSSVGGAPGSGATAVAVLSDDPLNCTASLRCYVREVIVSNPGKGYMYPPSVTFSGGGGTETSPAHGARATAIISGGTVIRVEMDPLQRGFSYTTPPSVHLTATRDPTTYDEGVGHGTWNLDQSALSVHQGAYKQTSNYMVGHGAFPGHPGNQNLGHPRKDCIYFLYSDIYVSPSGSDSTGQGTAGRPYRTIQKCIDASLAGPRDFYVYKKADGGDRDPRVPDGVPRYGTESAGERVDATGAFDDVNTPTGRDTGYTGRQVRNYNGRETGWRQPTSGQLYGGRSWSDKSRNTQKGFGYTINRDRCVLKDGVYWGEGNRELQPHGHMVQVWAENAHKVTLDCGGRSIGKNIFAADKHEGERAAVVGSVSLHGVVMRRCNVRADPKPNYRPYYPGRPGYGPGTKNPNGQLCWPGATGCQYRSPVDGMAAGQ